MSSAAFILVVGFLLSVSTTTPVSLEPSPLEYGILQQVELRNISHNLVLGWRQYGDRLLFRDTVNKNYRFGAVVSTELSYPPRGVVGNETLTSIVAIDQNSGYANVTRGGVGLKTITLRFKSKRSRSIKFLVEIYGK